MNIGRVMDRLRNLASKSDCRHKIGCLILDGRGKVISSGYNSMKTHPVQKEYSFLQGEEYKVYLHAEVSALVSLSRRYSSNPGKKKGKPYHLYTLREDKNGNLVMSRPCPICYEYIKDSGIKWISYTLNNVIVTEKVN